MCAPRHSSDDVDGYVPREPGRKVLFRAVADALETFLALARERDRLVPRFVEEELRAYLECGILAHGFLRVHCDACGKDRLVPFSCKGRGFCPSCGGRRTADTAAHLADAVFPEVPVRQWVLTVPAELRYRMAFDAGLTAEALRTFIRALFASLRRRARERRKIRFAHAGAVTFVQRFGEALNLNVHFHVLALDGVFDADDPEDLRFVSLAPPGDKEILRVARRFARRLARLLERRGRGGRSEEDGADALARDQPLLAELCDASLRERAAAGPRAGQRLRRLGDRIEVENLLDATPAGCARVGGISVHAAVAVPARDRRRLEHLCRYAARPALASERLSLDPDDRLLYRLRHRRRDGATHLPLDPLELLERFAVLVPPPRFHLVRYYGILAPRAAWRDKVTPSPPRPADGPGAERSSANENPPDPEPPDRRAARDPRDARRPSPHLLRRVFAVEALTCPRCGQPMRVLAATQSPDAIRAILECLGASRHARRRSHPRRSPASCRPTRPNRRLTAPTAPTSAVRCAPPLTGSGSAPPPGRAQLELTGHREENQPGDRVGVGNGG